LKPVGQVLMQVPLLALAGLILVELALGGTPRILFMELLRRRSAVRGVPVLSVPTRCQRETQ
jgi:hypothetical protein